MSPGLIVLLVSILGLSAIMSGLSGLGFSAIGALTLLLLPPKLGVPLLMSLSTANQLMSLRQLKADLKPLNEWWPDGPAPYLVGGLIGVPVGLAILHALPTATLMAVFGAFLVIYAAYSMLKPAGMISAVKSTWMTSSMVGLVGGVIGGFTAFPGAAVLVWSGLRCLPKSESRAIVQPFILGLQVVSLAMLAVQHPETFGRTFWMLPLGPCGAPLHPARREALQVLVRHQLPTSHLHTARDLRLRPVGQVGDGDDPARRRRPRHGALGRIDLQDDGEMSDSRGSVRWTEPLPMSAKRCELGQDYASRTYS